MMIDPDTFYDRELKDKNLSQILTRIRGLKNEIARLKKLIESSDYNYQIAVYSTPHTQLSCNRLYLEKAKEALVEAGGTYRYSKAEQRAERFDASIPYIEKLVFSIGGHFDGNTTTSITFFDECMKVNKKYLLFDDFKPAEEQTVKYPESKENFIQAFQDLHLGEWKSQYNNFNVLDGTDWDLKLTFSNGHKSVHFSGSNAYPYNFDYFRSLIKEVSGEE